MDTWVIVINFFYNLVYTFLIAFGVILGGTLFAGIGALIQNQPPLKTMLNIAASLKIWAIAASLGGTFSSFEVIEQGLLKGDIRSVLKQGVYILSALIGSNVGYSLIKLLEKCESLWGK